MAGEVGQGIAGGAMTGAGTGFTVGGPIGAGIGAVIGGFMGGMQGAQQRKKMQAYDKAEKGVNPIDPQQVAFMDRIRRQEQSYRAGTDPASAFAMQNQQNTLAQTQANLVRTGQNNTSQLLRAQQNANMGAAQVGAQASQQANALLPMQGNITNLISERVYQRQQQNRAAAMARMEQGQQDLNNMFAGGLSVLPQIAGGLKGAGTKAFNPAAATSQINASLPAGRAMSAGSGQMPAGGWWNGPNPTWWTP